MEQAVELDNLIPQGIGSENTSKSMGFIMKLTLIIVMIMVVVFLARIGMALIFMFKNPSETPYILDGMLSGIEKKTITQNPHLSESVTIFRSRNQSSGMEFTWSTWLFVNSDGNFSSSDTGQWSHIFHKGPVNTILTDNCTIGDGDTAKRCGRNADSVGDWLGSSEGSYNYGNNTNDDNTNAKGARTNILSYGDNGLYSPDYLYGYEAGMAFPINSPGLYLSKETNELRFIMSTMGDYSNIDDAGSIGGNVSNKLFESIDISGIPLDKWFCLVIRAKNNVLDAYVNGVIHTRHYVEHVMKQTYYDVHFGLNGGWNGNISSLKYHNKGISAVEIQNICNKGPNLNSLSGIKPSKGDNISNLSQKWYGY
jgi:hypothetical protein